ncbi:two-component regulator propeller domain-containing protein [Parabacteroides sp. FAFU027]|uniref:type IX secretion system anionic LPS delivery protein PorZ n=1 Tax=Parabacteroides sp. FAFU027 TaxID=2922715 RepID=UPI001FAF32B3|nr:two-component regulator propeller domain-containing protein [Parabacteroides sp. FAFU027]
MKKLILITLFILSTFGLFAQIAVGKWRTHLAYSYVTQVEETPEKVYGVSDGALFAYDKTDNGIERYDKLSGLNDTKVSLISYSVSNKLLLIVYDNANIDILKDNGDIINIPDIYKKNLATDKTVNEIKFIGSKAYISCGYGVSVIDLMKNEVKESYTFNKKVLSTAISDSQIYIASTDGVYKASANSNLSDINNWTLISSKDFKKFEIFQGYLIALKPTEGIYKLVNGAFTLTIATEYLTNIIPVNSKLIGYGPSQIVFFESFDQFKVVNATNVYDVSSLEASQNAWIASYNNGINQIVKQSDNYIIETNGIKPGGPLANSPYKMYFSGDKLLVVGGGAWADRYNTKGIFMIFKDNQWSYFNTDNIDVQYGARDFMDVVEDPNLENHYLVSSWGEGVYEFKDGKFLKLLSNANSNMESIFPDNPHYIRIGGLSYDANGNLFVTNSGITNVVKVLTKEGTWVNLFYPDIANKSNVQTLFRDKRGYFWALNVRSGTRVFVFDPKTTISNTNDDQSIYYESFNYYDNSELKTFTPGSFGCIAEDKKGAIWIGTDIGPIVLNSPAKIFNSDFTASRIKIPRNDGTDLADYLLDGVSVTAIAVDGGNRKWIGTASNGVYLVSENGLQTIHHFTAANSPLLSDKILSIAIHPTTGEVFFGTDKGLISYRSDATTASTKYSDVYAFPNPVKPEYEGLITITGLKYKSTVRITDINGNSVFEGISEGGQITWNGRNRSGERVATGVYLVYAETSSGIDGVVTKIMVVH